jgi:Fe-S-cluster containining protein
MAYDDSNKFKVLAAIYSFYDHFIKDFSVACRPGCHICCTINIVATSLEAEYLLTSPFFNNIELKKLLFLKTSNSIYRPGLSTNQIADLCLRHQTIPPDRSEHGTGNCPFLDQKGFCSIYEHRPFSCRAMSSREICQPGGEANMEPFLVTVNLAMYQIIEHLDRYGVSGNLLDLLSESVNNQNIKNNSGHKFVPNMTLPGFLVAPEEHRYFKEFLHLFANFQVGDTKLKAFFPGILEV